MEGVSTIGLDLAKHVFQAHGANASGGVLFRKKLRRELEQIRAARNLFPIRRTARM